MVVGQDLIDDNSLIPGVILSLEISDHVRRRNLNLTRIYTRRFLIASPNSETALPSKTKTNSQKLEIKISIA